MSKNPRIRHEITVKEIADPLRPTSFSLVVRMEPLEPLASFDTPVLRWEPSAPDADGAGAWELRGAGLWVRPVPQRDYWRHSARIWRTVWELQLLSYWNILHINIARALLPLHLQSNPEGRVG